jgi:hypothetical protein
MYTNDILKISSHFTHTFLWPNHVIYYPVTGGGVIRTVVFRKQFRNNYGVFIYIYMGQLTPSGAGRIVISFSSRVFSLAKHLHN